MDVTFGSFKIRGIGHACQILAQRGAKRFVSSSGGNAGMAVAYAGRVLDIPVTAVVPQTTTARAQELFRRWVKLHAHVNAANGICVTR